MSVVLGIAIMPQTALALCRSVPKGANAAVVAKTVLDHSDIVGLAVLDSSRSDPPREAQRLTVIDAFKGSTGAILMESERMGNVLSYDESKFRYVPGRVGEIVLVTLNGPTDKAFVPACIAMWAHAVPVEQLIPAIKVEAAFRERLQAKRR